MHVEQMACRGLYERRCFYPRPRCRGDAFAKVLHSKVAASGIAEPVRAIISSIVDELSVRNPTVSSACTFCVKVPTGFGEAIIAIDSA